MVLRGDRRQETGGRSGVLNAPVGVCVWGHDSEGLRIEPLGEMQEIRFCHPSGMVNLLSCFRWSALRCDHRLLSGKPSACSRDRLKPELQRGGGNMDRRCLVEEAVLNGGYRPASLRRQLRGYCSDRLKPGLQRLLSPVSCFLSPIC